MSLCCIFNIASHYRTLIYQQIEAEWDCKWYFGENSTDIKGLQNGILKNVTYVKTFKVIGPITYQKGIGHLIRDKNQTNFLMLGDPMSLSTWWVMLQKNLFYRQKKVYLWTHGWYGREGFIKKWIKRIFFGLADHVFTYGDYAKSVAISQGFKADKITPIHNSLNYAEQIRIRESLKPSSIYKIKFGNAFPTLSFIGRLTKVKRLDMILDALKVLKNNGLVFNLVFIGDGEESERLKLSAQELNLSENVWFYGSSYDEAKNAELIYNSDLCIAPGNVGLTAIHSLVFGTPVITHNNKSWQMPEFEAIKSKLTGDFFEQGSVESLADTICNWFSCHQDRELVRKACYAEIDNNWTPEYQIKVLKSILNL